MAGSSQERRCLVENPARDADRAVLCATGELSELDRLQREVRDRAEREADRNLERCR